MKTKLIFIFVLFVCISGGLYVRQNKTGADISQTKEEAISQAKEYRSKEICTMALVPAIHEATGAKYTFPSGCLAPGWKPDL